MNSCANLATYLRFVHLSRHLFILVNQKPFLKSHSYLPHPVYLMLLMDFKEELSAKEKDFENLKDAEEELLMVVDDSDKVPYQIGEVLVEMTLEEAQAALEKAKEQCQQEIEALKKKAESHKEILNELKVSLYAKFGSNINLDLDDES